MFTLPKAISSGLERCSQAVEYALSIPSSLASNVSNLFDTKPHSAAEILLQAKEQGSALLGLQEGEVLVEIAKDDDGLHVFKATDSMLDNPVVIVEMDEVNGQVKWETNVENYLKKYIDKVSSADYGTSGRRWKQDLFSDLIKHFASNGSMKKQGDKVTLQLPGDNEALVFQGPYAEQKAEAVLKYFYLRTNTPAEEEASKPWDLVKGLSTSYLMLSGPMLIPCIEKHALPSQKRSQMENDNRFQLTANNSRATRTSLTQKMFTVGTGFAAGMLMTHNPSIGIFTGLLSSLSEANALSSLTDTRATTADATKNRETRKTDAIVRNALARRSAPISIVNPLSNQIATPGFPLTDIIYLPGYFASSNPNANIELSITPTNGTAAPNWLSMNMGTISLVKTLKLGATSSTASQIAVSNNYAFVTVTDSLTILDITNPINPILVNSYSFSGSTPNFVFLKGNHAILCHDAYPFSIIILDVSNPYNITLASTTGINAPIYFNPPFKNVEISGNYLYLLYNYYYDNGANAYYYNAITTYNITTPATPNFVSTYTWISSYNPNTSGSAIQSARVFGTYAYLNEGAQLEIRDVSNPSNPFVVSTISGVSSPTVTVQDNYMYLASGTTVGIYDITQISSPILKETVYLGPSVTGASDLFIQGNYLYVSCGTNGVKVVNVENPLNAQLIGSFATFGSATGACLSNNNLFIADGGAGLTIANAQQRILSGTPGLSDQGLWVVPVTASDDMGNSITESVAIHVGNINVTPIPNQQMYVGNTTLFAFNAGTFDFPQASFNYTASLMGGLPLPSFMNFDPSSRAFIFAPRSGNQGTYRIQVTADDGYGGTASTTFDLTVPDRPPVLEQPLGDQTAYTGDPFVYAFNNSTFTDADNDVLSYSARSVGSLSGLPGWLNFDPVLRQFYGTPFGKGVYPIQVTANDNNGGTVSNTFTITVPPTAPVVLNPPGTQTASTLNPYSFTLNSNTFFDVDNEPLSYTTDSLPSFLSFNNATRTFSGTPQSSDVGTYSISVHASDTDGLTASTTFSLNVLSSSSNNPPVLVKAIPDQSEKVGVPFTFTFDVGTFVDPSNNALTYQATLESGAPLPAGISFDPSTRTLSGVVSNPQALRISIRAVDPFGGFAVDTFTLNIVGTYPPIVLNPLPNTIATVGQPFEYHIPSDTFADVNNDKLNITVVQSTGQPLPQWLSWNPITSSLSGTPGPLDTDTYRPRILAMDAWASDGVGSVKSSFNISVGGESFWATFIKVGASLSSVLATGFTVWESRARIWNFFNKDKYHKGTETALVDDEYNHPISLKFKDVKVKAFYSENALDKLPDGLTYEGGKITGRPTVHAEGYFTIRIFDHSGYIKEEFDLIIKQNANDDDPRPDLTTLQKITRRLRHPLTRDVEHGDGGNSIGMSLFSKKGEK